METRADPLAANPDPLEGLDLSLAALFAGLALAEEVQGRLAVEGFDDARFGHGFVFQHLVAGPVTIGDLARAMDVTQQRASKATAELEELGYVRREPDPADARVRRSALTERGWGAIEAARRARAAVVDELRERLGGERIDAAEALLRDVLRETGADAAVQARRVRLPG
jgi:DNA-binding MarR family transcriptional regulator